MGLIWYQIYEDCAMNNEIIGWYCHNWNTYFLLIKEIDRVGGESVLQNQIEYLNQRCNTDRIFKILRTMEIFWSCLLPKMRLSIDLEGRYIGCNSSSILEIYFNLHRRMWTLSTWSPVNFSIQFSWTCQTIWSFVVQNMSVRGRSDFWFIWSRAWGA